VKKRLEINYSFERFDEEQFPKLDKAERDEYSRALLIAKQVTLYGYYFFKR
jgi:succinate dehydrogenase flavin-adding protein (antitoxin of CptAB toxin-antitoxin module)